jgi:hypothetical protein
MQTDQASNAWVTTCPEEHSRFNAKPFPVVAEIYFVARQECLMGLVGQAIMQKAGGEGQEREATCDAYGENLIKAFLSGS